METDEQTVSSQHNLMSFDFKKISSHLAQLSILVERPIAEKIQAQTIHLYKNHINAAGLKKIPDSYIETNYSNEITKALHNFILYHFVIDYISTQTIEKRIPVANHPRLTSINVLPNKNTQYIFDISLADQIDIREWKNFSFKAPKRKNYKDLDKQVSLFLKQQCETARQYDASTIAHSDWVCFDAHLLDADKKLLFDEHKSNLWLKIHLKTVELPLFKAFVDKKVGDEFITDNLSLLQHFDHDICDKHLFHIVVKSIVKGSSFALDSFKGMFRLKNKTDVHEKLIEVFSYRNDLSQRKAIIEEMFHLFLSKHRFEIPKHLVLRKQEEILNIIKKRPDYQVYKLQKNFLNQVELLAEKQLKEEILIDQIASTENINVELRDLHNYLNLFTNERLKEFVYFKPISGLEETTTPIHNSTLKAICRREKTLNYVLHHLKY